MQLTNLGFPQHLFNHRCGRRVMFLQNCTAPSKSIIDMLALGLVLQRYVRVRFQQFSVFPNIFDHH
jgi:hypothetical protein